MHDSQVLQVLQPHQQRSQELDPIANTHMLMLSQISLQGHSLQIFHRQVQRIPGLIHPEQLDHALTVHPSHDLYLILYRLSSLSFEGDLLHECLDGHLSIFLKVLSEVDTGEVSFPYFFDRLEELMEILAGDAR